MSKPLAPVRGIAERNRLAEQFFYLPRFVVNRMKNNKAIRALGVDDAEGYGMLALLRAAELWDENRGVKFVTYAIRCIWGTLLRESNRYGHLISMPAYRSEESYPQPKRADYPLDQLAGRLGDTEAASDEGWGDKTLAAGMRRLDERSRRVLLLRIVEERTARETAAIMGITCQRVAQIQQRACRRIRTVKI